MYLLTIIFYHATIVTSTKNFSFRIFLQRPTLNSGNTDPFEINDNSDNAIVYLSS